MNHASYGYTKNLGKVAFDTAIERVTSSLKTEGFGVLTEINVKSTLKEKIDADFRPYRILGACNPTMAHRALESDLMIGLLLPCNVIAFEEDDGTVTVSFVKPTSMFQVVDQPEFAELAGEVDQMIKRVYESL